MDSEDAVMRDFLDGPLTRDGAVHRLVGLGLLRENAEGLVSEWLEPCDKRTDEATEIERLRSEMADYDRALDHREQQILGLRAALKEIYDLQDRSFVSGEGKFMRAITIAREALL